MLNHKRIELAVSQAEQSFKDCWLKLMTVRKGGDDKSGILNAIITFQPTLGVALYKLESLYTAVSKEGHDLDHRRAQLNKNWLRRRIGTLNGFKHIIRETVDVGKMLGDSFAWIFYQGNHDLLRKHYEQQSNPHPPIGIGGRGEIEFVRRMPKYGRHIVLAHSTTTFLRVGDISLIDPDGFIVDAIGELKTKAEGETKLLIKLILVGLKSKPVELPLPPPKKQDEEPLHDDPLPPELQERLNRQIERMKESFTPPDKNRMLPSLNTMATAPFTYSKLLELYRRSSLQTWGHIKADRGLIILGLKHRGDSLYKCLTSKSGAINNRNLVRTGAVIKEILDSKLQHNSIRFGWLAYPSKGRYSLQLGMRPLFWWPLDPEVVEAILFKRFSVMSFYNPAFLLNELCHFGLEVESVSNGQIRIRKKIGDKHYEVQGMPYFIGLIQEYLIPDNSIAVIIQKFVESIEKADFKNPARVNMHLDFIFP